MLVEEVTKRAFREISSECTFCLLINKLGKSGEDYQNTLLNALKIK